MATYMALLPQAWHLLASERLFSKSSFQKFTAYGKHDPKARLAGAAR